MSSRYWWRRASSNHLWCAKRCKRTKSSVAKVGAVLPGNFKIKKAKLRGEESNGMICSLQELGIEGKVVAKEYAEGIFIFPE